MWGVDLFITASICSSSMPVLLHLEATCGTLIKRHTPRNQPRCSKRVIFPQRDQGIQSLTFSEEPLIQGAQLWDLMVRVVTEPKLHTEKNLAPAYIYSIGNRPTFPWKGNHLQIRIVLARPLCFTLENTSWWGPRGEKSLASTPSTAGLLSSR